MKIFVKTLKGSSFEIDVKPEDTVILFPLWSVLRLSELFYLFGEFLVYFQNLEACALLLSSDLLVLYLSNKKSIIFLSIYLVSGFKSVLQIADVKRTIENTQGSNVYPASQLMLIYQGSILKDDATLAESKVAENSFVVVMLSKVLFFLPLFNTCQLLNQTKALFQFHHEQFFSFW